MDHPYSNQNQNNKNYLSNTISTGQLIKFPTITKLTYDGQSTQLKTLYKTNSKLLLKNNTPSLPISNMTQGSTFRVVQVPRDQHLMKICMMNINQYSQKYRTMPKQQQHKQKQNVTRKTIAMALMRKQRSSSLLGNFDNSVNKNKDNQTITNKTTNTNQLSSLDKQQQQKRSRTQSLIKLKINRKILQSKININQIYFQIMNALALINGKVLINQTKNFQRIRRAKIEKGNNGYLVKQMIKKRSWWNTTEQNSDANLIWTQKTLKNLNNQQKKQQFFYEIGQQQQNQVIFQRNIDQILLYYPKMLQLFFIQQQINKITNTQQTLTSKAKKTYIIYNFLSNTKADRKIIPGSTILYNHIPNNFEITSKKMLYKNLWRYYHETKQNPYQFIPKTYHLTAFDWQQKIQFIKSQQNKNNPMIKNNKKINENIFSQSWFLKPGQNTNRGRGIQMFTKTTQVLDYIMRNPPKSISKSYILQQYINPLLYDNRKFDIRCYLLCIQVFDIQVYYWYQQGYIRTSSSKFTMNKTSISIHLTNDAVQKQFNNYDKYQSANKLSYLDIDKYIKNQYGFQFLKNIVPIMKKIATDVCKAGVQMGKDKGNKQSSNQQQTELTNNQNTNNTARTNTNTKSNNVEYPGLFFQIFGLDYIISKQGHPFLLQVNTNPCLQINSNLLSRVIPQMLQNTLRIVTDVYLPNKTTHNTVCPDWAQSFIMNNKFSLIYRRELQRKQQNAEQKNKNKQDELNNNNKHTIFHQLLKQKGKEDM